MPDTYGGEAGELLALGEAIKKARKEAGLRQRHLAAAIGRTRLTVSKYETGYRAPSYADLIYIARACKVPVSTLCKALDSVHVPLVRGIKVQVNNPYGMRGKPKPDDDERDDADDDADP